MTDARTLRVYAGAARTYADLTAPDHGAADRDAFLAALPEGTAPVLDWGCGPGHDGVRLMADGVAVEATDASPEMVALAIERGVPARHEPFEGLPAMPVYRGIWAAFSLLHAAPGSLPALIDRAARALLPGGILFLAMKRGRGSRRDALGRLYTYVEPHDLDRMTDRAGLHRLTAGEGEGTGLDGVSAPFVTHLSCKPHA